MLYLVRHPNLRKAVQMNAESEEEAIARVFDPLPEWIKLRTTIADCSAEPCPDPMSQFVKRFKEA
jgi:hypothetical protein